MKISLHRALVAAIGITVVGLVISGVLGNSRHGAAGTVADIAWFAFLLGALATIGLAITVIVTSARRRRRAG